VQLYGDKSINLMTIIIDIDKLQLSS